MGATLSCLIGVVPNCAQTMQRLWSSTSAPRRLITGVAGGVVTVNS